MAQGRSPHKGTMSIMSLVNDVSVLGDPFYMHTKTHKETGFLKCVFLFKSHKTLSALEQERMEKY